MARLPGLRITNLWTPAQIDTVGNELADDAAKAATRLIPPPSIPVSLTTCNAASTPSFLSAGVTNGKLVMNKQEFTPDWKVGRADTLRSAQQLEERLAVLSDRLIFADESNIKHRSVRNTQDPRNLIRHCLPLLLVVFVVPPAQKYFLQQRVESLEDLKAILRFQPLVRVNKCIAKCITGGYRTASGAALEKEAAILPAQLRLESSLLSRPSRVCPSLSSSAFPLFDGRSESRPKALVYVNANPAGARGKRGGAVTGLRAQGLSPHTWLGLERIIPVYSPPLAVPLPVTTVNPDKEDAVDVLKQLLADGTFAGASLLDGSAGGAAVRFERGIVHERILIPLGDGQVAEGEIEGLVRGTQRALANGVDRIFMVSDSQAALQGITSMRARSRQFRAIQFDALVRSALSRYPALSITNLWTPAHIGTVGNELADEAAKAATLLPPAPTVPVSLTTCRREVEAVILEQWRTQWKIPTPGRGLREIDDSSPSLILRSPYISSASRSNISILSHRFLSSQCPQISLPACHLACL
ncbi:hypothetical protein B0H13DRAFT_2305613 [Mycena leptocephala]|nr:hypothetical protein B0H13DRAFT_2305613 [Mycena leptocephala]